MSDPFVESAESEVDKDQARRAIGKLAALLDRQGISPEDIGKVARVNAWQGFYKNAEGDAVTQDMVGISFSPKFAEGPDWPVIQQAKPTRPRKPTSTVERDTFGQGHNIHVILPDPQIGFRHHGDGTLEPFHDEAAMAVALAITKSIRPDHIVNLGDFLDLPEQSTKFRKEAAFARTTQMSLDRAHEFLAQQREAGHSSTVISLLEGNHDVRLKNYVIDNALAAFGLRQANMPESWPVMSVQNLLRLDELGVTYYEGYPQGIVWLNESLACIHGVNLKPEKTLAEEDASQIHGHTHSIYRKSRTRRSYAGRKTITVSSPGCLCRVDGGVPSTKSATAQDGKTVTSVEDWQQGIAVVETFPDGTWSMEQVEINDGVAHYRGRTFRA
jgi:hypothetical protein